jgi:hypothetical protein
MSKKSHRSRTLEKNKRAAIRIAVFFDTIGIQPRCEGRSWAEILMGLLNQYQSVPIELRREARRHGRILIREQGLLAIATSVVSGPARALPKPRSPQAPAVCRAKCPQCRTWDFKSIWPNKEAAEEFCWHSGDGGLQPYPCPYGNGWHAGHSKAHRNGQSRAIHTGGENVHLQQPAGPE